jgi:protein-tyrosine phosphatase
MIDIHTHLLPACDDGSADLETSLLHLQLMANAGYTDVVLTPHYMRNQYHNIRSLLFPGFENIKKAVLEKNIPLQLHIGSEVYLDIDIQNDIINEKLMISDTKFVLVETGMNDFPPYFLDSLYQIVLKGFTPILAHPERYSPIMNNLNIAEDLLHRNVLLQLNLGSLMGGYGRQAEKTAWKLLDKGFAHFLATDNHAKRNDFPYQKVLDTIREKYDDYLVELLTKINPLKMLNNEKIDFFYVEKVEVKLNYWQRVKDFFTKRN